MPEEINRSVPTDQISDILFTTESSGRDNLVREGIDDARIRFVGNVMIDTLRRNLPRAHALVGASWQTPDPLRFRVCRQRLCGMLTPAPPVQCR